MPQRILSSLTWKAGVAVAATALAAGAGATTVHLVNDSHPADDPAVEISDHATTTTTTDSTTTTTVDDKGDDAAATRASADSNATTEHPDNFGKTVSEDARDGGVDGQEISDMAHERNAARSAGTDHATAEDHSDEAGDHPTADDADTDHRADAGTEHGQNDSHQDDDTED